MKFYKLGLGCVLIASVMSQTRVDLRTQAKDVDFSGASSTKPSQTGTVLPAACSVGQTFFKTDAPAGQNSYACTAANVWTIQGGGSIITVFGRTGAVTAQTGDYSAAQISGLAPSATTDTTSAANISNGILGAARLPTPGAATLGGVQSKDCTSGGQFLQKINIDGTETCGTPAGGGNVSGPGTVTNGYLAAWGAANNLLTTGLAVSAVPAANTVAETGVGGTLAAGWLPSAGSHTVSTTAPLSGGGAVALGGTLTLSCPTCLTANAVPSVFGRTGTVTAQSGDYSAGQISGLATVAASGSASDLSTGTLGAARLPNPGAATLGGVQSKDCTSGGQFLQKINIDGTETCGTPAGGGNVSGPGTVTNGYLAAWGAANNLLTTGLAVSAVPAANTVAETGVGGTLAAGWLPSAGSHTVSTTAPLSGGGAVALGGTLTLSCPTCLTANAVPSVFGRTGAVTAQSGDYAAAQIAGLAPSATTDTTSASNISSGILGAARLPTPGAATLGGVQSKDCTSGGQFLQKINIDGTETCGTPAGGGNVSGPGTVTNGYLAAWGAANNLLTTGLAVSAVPAANTVAETGVGGTLAAGWLPSAGSHTVSTTAPLSGGGAVALGGTLTLSCPTCLTASAVPSVFGRTGAVTAQSGDYSAGQISGLATVATSGSASDLSTGTLGAARLPNPGAATLGGVQSKDCTTGGQFLQKINIDGTETCGTPAGGGNVSGPGTVTNGYLAAWGAANNLLTTGLAVSAVPAANTVAETGVGGTLAAGWLPSAGSHTVSTTAPLSGGGAVALGGTLTLSCPTCLTASAVPSVFGRTGAVTAQSGDYSAGQISGLATVATSGSASDLSTGTLGAARLPTPGAATLGGVQSKDCTSGGQFLQKINIDGTETCGTPAGGGGGLADPGANGIVSRTALNTLTARTITGGTGITVANGDGVAGAPLISMDTTVAITQAQVQNLAPLVFNGSLIGSVYGGAMSPPPGAFVDLNNNPLVVDFCPNVTWTGGAVSINVGFGPKRILVAGYDPPANIFVATSCYLLMYNASLTVDGVASIGAFELKSPPSVSPYLALSNATTTGTTLYKLTKLTGIPSTAVSAGTGDTGGIVGITAAGAGTTLTAVIQMSGNSSCIFDGPTTAGHYVQISSTVAGDCHDSGAAYPTSGQVIGRVLSTNAGTGTYAIQLFGAEVQAAAQGSGSGTVTSVATTGPLSGGTITTSGTISCATCVTGGALTNGQLLKGAGSQGLQTADLTGDVVTAGSLVTTIAANSVTSAKMAAVNTRRTCSVVIGADNGSALANADIGPQGRQCLVSAAASVVEITIAADAGVPSVLIRKNHGGTATNLTSAALVTAASGGLSCANAAGSGLAIDGATTCTTALTAPALAAGDWLELASGTADGTARRMSISVTYTVN